MHSPAWLENHPVEGPVLRDSKGRAGNAYETEIPANVIVGAYGGIVGCFMMIPEIENLVEAAPHNAEHEAIGTTAKLSRYAELQLVKNMMIGIAMSIRSRRRIGGLWPVNSPKRVSSSDSVLKYEFRQYRRPS